MPGVLRKICEPPLRDSGDPTALDVHSQKQFKTVGCETMEKYVSSSFLPILKEIIPRSDTPLGFGGCWFWSCYFHGLYGEDVLLDLNGTGISLSEDSLDTQLALRKMLARSSEGEYNEVALEHCCSKLEALCGLCLSVVLHVARQPMLEDEKGPQAVVFCATKDQCDEVHDLLDRFGSSLHLVSHNLFGAYPPMPAGRRADIVVGTLPLWESVSTLNPSSSKDGLEEILYHVPHDMSKAASSTRWRPYTLNFVDQLVLVDLDLQLSLGYGPILKSLFGEYIGAVIPTSHHLSGTDISRRGQMGPVPINRLPQGCQMYGLVCGNGKGKEFFTLCASLRYSGNADKTELACINLGLQGVIPEKENGRNPSVFPRKRKRECFESDSPATARHLKQDIPKLVVHNALSHSRLMKDTSAFEEFSAEARRRAQSFWSRFEGASSPSGGPNVSPVVNIELAYACMDVGERLGRDGGVWFVTSTVAIIAPVDETSAHPSRTTLLMQHLADEFSGQLFDGSVVQCFHLCHAVRHIESRDVVLGSVFATTAKLLCQDPLFFFMDDGKESDDNGAAVLGRRAELREAAVRASSAVMSEAFPLHKFLSGTPCPSKRTVLVLRSIDSPRTVNCVTPVTKPALFLYLEECCQYGKVLSYFVYTQLGSEGDEGTVDFFVEFQTCEGAAEAVRQFSIRFANQMQRNGMSTRVKLFSNDLYYEGVTTELRKASNKSPDERDRGGVVFGSEEDFMDISLLAE